MARIILPSNNIIARKLRGWPSSPNQKPQVPAVVDYAKQIPNAKLMAAILVRDQKIELVNNVTPSVDLYGTVKVDPNAGGQYIDFPDTSGQGTQFQIPSRVFSTNEYVSVAVRVKFPAVPDTGSYIDVGSASGNRYTLYSISNRSYFYTGTGAGNFYRNDTADTLLNDGNWHVVCASMRVGNNYTHHTLWVDGTEYLSTSTDTVNAGALTVDTVTLGNSYPLSYEDEVYISDAYVFDGQITQSDVDRLTADFYRLYKPANQSPFIVGTAAAAGGDIDITVPQGDLTLSSTVPTVSATANISVTVPQANLTLSTTAPTVDAAANVAVTVPQADLVLSTSAPAVAVTANIAVTVPQADLLLSTTAPTVEADGSVSRTVPQADLVLSTAAPTVERTDNQSIEIPQGDLTLSSEAPTVSAGFNITVPGADLVLSTLAPEIAQTTAASIIVPTADLLLSTSAPTVTVAGPVSIEVPQADLSLSASAPTVVNSGQIWTDVVATSSSWTEVTDNSDTWTEI